MSQHAVLSPSSGKRWMSCTPSARLEMEFTDKGSEAAREGTLAHKLAENMIRLRLGDLSEEALAAIEECKADSLYSSEMLHYIQEYVDYVLEQFESARAHTADAVIFLEHRIDLTAYIPEGFGTGDVIIIADGVLRIIDLKYGKGVPVSAVDNHQMKIYGLGALREFEILYHITEVEMTIYQPRLDSISVWSISEPELCAWGADELVPKARMAFEGKGEFVAGDHCRFCKAASLCRANAEKNLEVAQYEFREAPLLTDAEVADILSRADQFTKWISGVEEFALEAAVKEGKRWPGYKLVEGRSNRTYSDREKVATTLKEGGFTEEQIYEPQTLLSITAMEKSIGKKAFSLHLDGLIVKPAGKPALVPASDKRPELNSIDSAINDFS
ncbi:DUF2800 domain-containing protein [Chitinophaga sp. NPDC101104]|uniref:DUF2800 domain-containing protein n=1 Tax=Chitinophaga sp. NPDC101104 TaxID=3390561 RepID=UPI003CFF7576